MVLFIYLALGVVITSIAGLRNWMGITTTGENTSDDQIENMCYTAIVITFILFWPIMLILGIIEEIQKLLGIR